MKKKSLFQLLLTSIALLILLWCALASLPVYAAAQRTGTTIPQGTLAQVVITPTKDNTLFESTIGQFSNGAGSAFFVGNTRTDSRRRGLISFDLTHHLPAGATILSVTLQLQMIKTSSEVQNIELHRMQANWGEGASDSGGAGGGGGTDAQTNDATWLHTFFPTSTWSKPGGDFSTTISAATSVDAKGKYTWGSTTGMVADAQSWLDTPAINFGWMLLGNENSTKTAKAFASKESDASTRPQLTIVYQAPSGAQQLLYLPVIQR